MNVLNVLRRQGRILPYNSDNSGKIWESHGPLHVTPTRLSLTHTHHTHVLGLQHMSYMHEAASSIPASPITSECSHHLCQWILGPTASVWPPIHSNQVPLVSTATSLNKALSTLFFFFCLRRHVSKYTHALLPISHSNYQCLWVLCTSHLKFFSF